MYFDLLIISADWPPVKAVEYKVVRQSTVSSRAALWPKREGMKAIYDSKPSGRNPTKIAGSMLRIREAAEGLIWELANG
jgi:hypothetical protein